MRSPPFEKDFRVAAADRVGDLKKVTELIKFHEVVSRGVWALHECGMQHEGS